MNDDFTSSSPTKKFATFSRRLLHINHRVRTRTPLATFIFVSFASLENQNQNTMKTPIYMILVLVLVGLLERSLVFGQEAATEAAVDPVDILDDASATTTSSEDSGFPASTGEDEAVEVEAETEAEVPVQSGPFIDLFGPELYSLQLIDETTAQLTSNYTNEVLAGKKVVGLYFSADWCGPCRQFTPELISFYDRMNSRRGKKDQFEIVWISRCRDGNSYVQYFAHMPWLALPPEEAMGPRGQKLGEKYKVKGIPSLVLVDDLGQTITIDGRNKIPQDRTGIGFPWRGPLAQLYVTLFPRSLRLMIKNQVDAAKAGFVGKLKSMVGLGGASSRARRA